MKRHYIWLSQFDWAALIGAALVGFFYLAAVTPLLMGLPPSYLLSNEYAVEESFWFQTWHDPIALFTLILSISTIGLWWVTWRTLKHAKLETNERAKLLERDIKSLAFDAEEARGEIAKANERAAKADLARAELEAKLLPRMLNQDQWDFIQGLRGKFPIVAIAFETDAETRWFAGQIRDAFFSAGIPVAMYPRAAEVHSFGTFIFEPKGFDGARPRTVEPLVEIFRKAELIGSLAIITEVPTDIVIAVGSERPEMRAPLDTPMIIVGGRFVIPPPHLERAAKAAKAAMDATSKKT